MGTSRLAKMVYLELINLHFNKVKLIGWNYLQEVSKVLVNNGLDHIFTNTLQALRENGTVESKAKVAFQNIAQGIYQTHLSDRINTGESLKFYSFGRTDCNRACYTYDPSNFNKISLKFRARTGTLGLGTDLERQYRNGNSNQENCVPSLCKYCGSDREDLTHFMLSCPTFADCRVKMMAELETELLKNSYDHIWEFFMGLGLLSKMAWLIGDHSFLVSPTVGAIFDRHSKNYLLSSFIERERIESRDVEQA